MCETKFRFGSRLKPDDFVYINHRTGNPIGDSILNHHVDQISKKTGLKRITSHGLRHTHATILIGQRIPDKVTADRFGNTPQMIFDVYGHSFKEL